MQPLIFDIQTTALLYYDPAFEEQCYQFCLERDIDCLPALEDERIVYRYDKAGGSFVKGEIGEGQKVDGRTCLFDASLLERFQREPLLFVHTDGYLTGVIHFSDYNRPEVSVYLYRALFDFEKALRELLLLRGIDDTTMLAYFAEKASTAAESKKGYWTKKIAQMQVAADAHKTPPLQQFYLDDLLGLAKDRKVIDPRGGLVDLRNAVMHVRDHVQLQNFTAKNAVYDRESFAKFFKLCLGLHGDLKRIKNQVLYLQSVS